MHRNALIFYSHVLFPVRLFSSNPVSFFVFLPSYNFSVSLCARAFSMSLCFSFVPITKTGLLKNLYSPSISLSPFLIPPPLLLLASYAAPLFFHLNQTMHLFIYIPPVLSSCFLFSISWCALQSTQCQILTWNTISFLIYHTLGSPCISICLIRNFHTSIVSPSAPPPLSLFELQYLLICRSTAVRFCVSKLLCSPRCLLRHIVYS